MNRPVAGVVLEDSQGRYLLVQERQAQAYGLWNLPAGWIDEGETPQQAAIREAREEVGFEVELRDEEPLHIALNTNKDRVLNSFHAKIIGGELKFQADELLDAKWLTMDEVGKLKKDGKLRADWVLESIEKAEKSAK